VIFVNSPNIPKDVRKACMILGVDPSSLTKRVVIDAWKKRIAMDSDPDGGVDAALIFTAARDKVARWLGESKT
jgi:hypothetical protein